jgi:competence protein ComEC
VGQGDSALVTFPDGETLLIDGGGKPRPQRSSDGNENEPFEPDTRRVGEAVVSEVLWAKGYSHIGHILATHSDVDHMQGLSDVARNFVVGSALFGRLPEGSSEFAEIEDVLRRRGIPVEIIARGDVLKFGDTTVDVLWPDLSNDSDDVYDNKHSAVIRIVYGLRSFLLVGDIESESEAALVTRGDALRSDLIKVAHHGSRTSSSQQMVDKVNPTYAVVSVGRYSRFGHPNADVIQRWIANSADVRTTGERGLISVSTEGKDLRLETFLK